MLWPPRSRVNLGAALIVVAALACTGESGVATPTAAPTSVDPSAVVLSWTRAGGIAGFCDGLVLTAGHRTTLGDCEQQSDSTTSGELAPNDAIRVLESWRGEFASFDEEWADGPEIADGLTVRVSFVGRGSRIASDATRREIAEFAASLFATIRAQQPRAAGESVAPASSDPQPRGARSP